MKDEDHNYNIESKFMKMILSFSFWIVTIIFIVSTIFLIIYNLY